MRKPLRLASAFVLSTLSACSSVDPDPHGHTDAAQDLAGDVSRDVPVTTLDRSAEDAAVDATLDRAGDALGAVCDPPCSADQVCCTDQHGHFPACRTGSTCADAGGS